MLQVFDNQAALFRAMNLNPRACRPIQQCFTNSSASAGGAPVDTNAQAPANSGTLNTISNPSCTEFFSSVVSVYRCLLARAGSSKLCQRSLVTDFDQCVRRRHLSDCLFSRKHWGQYRGEVCGHVFCTVRMLNETHPCSPSIGGIFAPLALT